MLLFFFLPLFFLLRGRQKEKGISLLARAFLSHGQWRTGRDQCDVHAPAALRCRQRYANTPRTATPCTCPTGEIRSQNSIADLTTLLAAIRAKYVFIEKKLHNDSL